MVATIPGSRLSETTGATCKRLVVLANSIRHAPCRCVAGREVHSDRAPVEFGGWVRPVSDHGDGELYEQEIKLDDKSAPRVLDVIDVFLSGKQEGHVQPENWYLARRHTWRKVGRMARSHLPLLAEEPGTLWHLRGRRSDRVAVADAARMQIEQSLYLIRPQALRVKFWTQPLPETQSQKHYRRAVFSYHGVEYNLSLTDPVVNARYDQDFPQVGDPPREEPLPCGDECLLCVSLAREYQGWHYKVVATVVEL
jgi:hypothetical protein